VFFQVDQQGDSAEGIKSITEACGDLNVTVPATIVYQKVLDYCFEFHTGMHGTPVVYVNHSGRGDRISRNVPSIEIGPPTQWQRGEKQFKSKEARDALNVVTQNQILFQNLFTAWTA